MLFPTQKNRKKWGNRGNTLVEVVLAMLLIGIMCALVMPVFLSGSMAAGRSERREAAADAVRQLSEELKSYVTANPALATGPGDKNKSNGWSLRGDSKVQEALAPGKHELDVTQWAKPLVAYKGKLSYTVIPNQTLSGNQPKVQFDVTWDEP